MPLFQDFDLAPPLARAIEELGYSEPTPVQAETLPILLGQPTDFVGLAATGTGKTAAFAIPLLQKIDVKLKTTQGLVMCPTRELALQVAKQIEALGKYVGVRTAVIYGGSGYGDQFRALRAGAHIVIGTPGRIIDHMDRGSLDLGDLRVVVLDEADEMISMGFREDLEKILESAPRPGSLIWLFSATMSTDVRKVANHYLSNPQSVQVNRSEIVPASVEQVYYKARESDKPEILCKLIEAADDFYGIVFCQTKSLVAELTQYLADRGYKADCLHGDKSQADRERTMQSFRDRKVAILVCTDVASRGLDVKDISHVVNYTIPRELDVYVHRIGRTARSGKSGTAISLVSPAHRSLIAQVERKTRRQMCEGRIPTRRDLGAKKVDRLLSQFKEQPHFARALIHLKGSWAELLQGMSAEEVAARFLTMMSPEIFAVEDVVEVERRPDRSDWDAPQFRRRQDPRRANGGGGQRPPRKQSGPRDFRSPSNSHRSRPTNARSERRPNG